MELPKGKKGPKMVYLNDKKDCSCNFKRSPFFGASPIHMTL